MLVDVCIVLFSVVVGLALIVVVVVFAVVGSFVNVVEALAVDVGVSTKSLPFVVVVEIVVVVVEVVVDVVFVVLVDVDAEVVGERFCSDKSSPGCFRSGSLLFSLL